MTYFDNQYDNMYPLHPQYIDADSAADINPTVTRQQAYRAALPQQISSDSYNRPTPRVNTFSTERMMYDMSRQIGQMYYMIILLVILLVVVIVCSVITVSSVSIAGRRQ